MNTFRSTRRTLLLRLIIKSLFFFSISKFITIIFKLFPKKIPLLILKVYCKQIINQITYVYADVVVGIVCYNSKCALCVYNMYSNNSL